MSAIEVWVARIAVVVFAVAGVVTATVTGRIAGLLLVAVPLMGYRLLSEQHRRQILGRSAR